MRVGVDRTKYSIQIPLPPKIDPTVSLMTVEDKPDVTYDDVGGAKDSIEKVRMGWNERKTRVGCVEGGA